MSMNQEQATLWKAEASKRVWNLDDVHCAMNDCLLFTDGKDGLFANYFDGKLHIGTFEMNLDHIGNAVFTVEGKKPFRNANEAVAFLVAKARIKISPGTIRELMRKGLL